MQNKRKKAATDLAAAVSYINNAYKLLTDAGRKEARADLQGAQNDIEKARTFFKMFYIAIKRVENIEQAAKDAQKYIKQPAAYVVNLVNNDLIIKNKKQ